jgi:hypothetical protein
MSRPRKCTVDYFPHDCTHRQTMFILESRYGNDGYAFWFKLLEMLGSSENHFIDCKNDTTQEFLQAKTRLDWNKCREILDLLAKLGAIDPELWAQDIVWSDNFMSRISDAYKNRRVDIPIKPDFYRQKPEQKDVSTDGNPQTKLKETKLNKTNCAFLNFYEAYPLKKSKGQAEKTWNKLLKSGDLPDIEVLKNAIQNQISERARKKQSGQFVPEWKYPSTWLNSKSWEDNTADTMEDIEARVTDSGYDQISGKYITPDGKPRVCL